MNTVIIQSDSIDPPAWQSALERFALKILDHMKYTNWELSIILCNNEIIKNLNLQYRGKDEATDVLSFSQIGNDEEIPKNMPFLAGDIVISLEYLKENAAYFNVNEEEELKRLVIHGILHLSGMDHSDNSPDQEMLQLQERILYSFQEEKIF